MLTGQEDLMGAHNKKQNISKTLVTDLLYRGSEVTAITDIGQNYSSLCLVLITFPFHVIPVISQFTKR